MNPRKIPAVGDTVNRFVSGALIGAATVLGALYLLGDVLVRRILEETGP